MVTPPAPQPLPEDLKLRLSLLTAKPAIRKFPGLVTAIVQLVSDAWERKPPSDFRAQLDARIGAAYEEAWHDESRQRAYIQGLLTARELLAGTSAADLTLPALADGDSEAQADAAEQRAEYGYVDTPGLRDRNKNSS